MAYSGSTLFVPNGNIIFTPGGDLVDALALGETAVATIDFTFEDEAGAEGQGSIEVTITGINDDPEAEDATFAGAIFDIIGGEQIFAFGGPFFDISGSATDVDGDNLTFSVFEDFTGDLSDFTTSLQADGSAFTLISSTPAVKKAETSSCLRTCTTGSLVNGLAS